MPTPDLAALLDHGDFSLALIAWHSEFAGREDAPEASWILAGLEERWGDSLFFGGESDSAAHYRAAQRALVPPGTVFSSSEENERRMEAHGRLTNKLYAVGPDGRARPGDSAQPHPLFRPAPPRPVESITERRHAVVQAQQKRTKQQSDFGALYQYSDQWCHHRLGDLWFEAATALAAGYPAQAHQACEWSLHYFGLYNQAWTAHLPASRWDSDGGGEMMEVHALNDSLSPDPPPSTPPAWVSLLLAGDWQGALAALDEDEPAPEFKPLAVLLADARQAAAT